MNTMLRVPPIPLVELAWFKCSIIGLWTLMKIMITSHEGDANVVDVDAYVRGDEADSDDDE